MPHMKASSLSSLVSRLLEPLFECDATSVGVSSGREGILGRIAIDLRSKVSRGSRLFLSDLRVLVSRVGD